MALLLQLRTITKANTVTITNPSLLHRLFSTSNSSNGGDQPPTNSNSPFSSYFRDVKDSLKKQQQQQQQKQPSTPSPPRSPQNFSFTASSNSKQTSLEDIRRNLSEFRRRTSVPPPGDPSSSQQISFQELYKRNVLQKPDESTGNADLGTGKPGGKFSLDPIRESLRQITAARGGGGDRKGADRMSLPALKGALKLRPSDSASSTVIGGTSALPDSVFGREMREKIERDGSSAAMKTEFVKMYGYGELGEKLRKLRPEGKGKGWFSLGELNERLMRLREMEEKESLSSISGVTFKDLRESLMRLQVSDDEKAKKTSLQRLDILGQLGGTPNYLLEPPKQHLVEKYFHPDNMSSAEKLKIELTKVRDEFKMSESDCGSARVQVAQLTTKIKHLSSVLHKKDVHSRKGVLAMVQRRKRLLKYLRRTDWDSYCFVISKLGLRDNPDHSYKSRTGGQAASS